MMPATIPTDFYQYVDGLRTDIIVDCAHTPIWWDGEVFRFGEDGRPSQSAIETLVTGIAIREHLISQGRCAKLHICLSDASRRMGGAEPRTRLAEMIESVQLHNVFQMNI